MDRNKVLIKRKLLIFSAVISFWYRKANFWVWNISIFHKTNASTIWHYWSQSTVEQAACSLSAPAEDTSPELWRDPHCISYLNCETLSSANIFTLLLCFANYILLIKYNNMYSIYIIYLGCFHANHYYQNLSKLKQNWELVWCIKLIKSKIKELQ